MNVLIETNASRGAVVRPRPPPRTQTGIRDEEDKKSPGFREALLPSQEFGDGFRSGPDLEFFVDAADVSVHRFVADAQFLRDFLVQEALGETIEDFFFARR